MQHLYQDLNPKRIKLNKLVEKLRLAGKMELTFIEETLKRSSSILKKQPNLLSLRSPAIIIGDIHGQFYDLLNILDKYSFEENNFLFLGDYVDRGQFCIEVLTLLMVLKIQYPNNIHLLRGNHQSKNMTSQYNFKLQCCKKYSVDMYEKFLDWFKLLPIAATIDNKYFCVHGGISPDFVSLSQLQRIRRNIQVPDKGLLCDLLWSDPTDDDDKNWETNSIRGISYFYSRSLAEKFLKKNDFKMIIRAHQLQEEGFKFQKSNKRYQSENAVSLTLFSAPNYCDKFNNKGAVAVIKNNRISIQTFNEVPHPVVLPDYMDVFEWTLPFISKCLQHLFKNMIAQANKKGSKSFDMKQIKRQLDEYEESIIIKSLLDQVIVSKNQPFPTKYKTAIQNQNLQKNKSPQTEFKQNMEFKQNKENLNIPGPFKCKFHKVQRKSLKPCQSSLKQYELDENTVLLENQPKVF